MESIVSSPFARRHGATRKFYAHTDSAEGIQNYATSQPAVSVSLLAPATFQRGANDLKTLRLGASFFRGCCPDVSNA